MIKTKELTLSETYNAKKVTVYFDDSTALKASILYFHGGGLIYGSRNDLPQTHIETICKRGYAIIAFDYPLSPPAQIGEILTDVISSITSYIADPSFYIGSCLPFFLWGRSAGAYLVLLAACSGKLSNAPLGILSYYGYGLFVDNWLEIPSQHYRTLPMVENTFQQDMFLVPHTEIPFDIGFSSYVYARQNGSWLNTFFHQPAKYFYRDYSLQLSDALPCPLFCAHSIGDVDVPYAEFSALKQRFSAETFIALGSTHDFDRLESDPNTTRLLKNTVSFLDRHTPAT